MILSIINDIINMGDIMEYFLSALLIILIICFVVYVIIIYNKLNILDEELFNIWKELKISIDNLVIKVNDLKIVTLKNIVKDYKTDLDIMEIMEYYLKLEKRISKSRNNELKILINEINDMKLIYNNKVLKYNNMVNSLVYCFISKIFGFEEYTYFRNNK